MKPSVRKGNSEEADTLVARYSPKVPKSLRTSSSPIVTQTVNLAIVEFRSVWACSCFCALSPSSYLLQHMHSSAASGPLVSSLCHIRDFLSLPHTTPRRIRVLQGSP